MQIGAQRSNGTKDRLFPLYFLFGGKESMFLKFFAGKNQTWKMG